MEIDAGTEQSGLMDIEAVQKALNRSRASIYRYANTDLNTLNPEYDPQLLNPELRTSKDAPLLFHPNEVARFARDVLKIKQVTIEVRESAPTPTQELLQAILAELQSIHQLLKARS
ncbi:resolvase [Kovacikia minuta CCNUW1]|uniref:resolvase n=1 Tax=Kovacikia minuta TaxID=2931930 RepID=UPI001CCFC19A|nr:resolvase [Kovacikia minuta]UBF25199.1 resolvase [Kovacikia minuta CCNUW1]